MSQGQSQAQLATDKYTDFCCLFRLQLFTRQNNLRNTVEHFGSLADYSLLVGPMYVLKMFS